MLDKRFHAPPLLWGTYAGLTALALVVLQHAALVVAAVPAALLLYYAALRIQVTATHVHVKLGPFGPSIPLGCIRSAEAVSHDWMGRRLGVFVHSLLRGTAGAAAEDAGKALRIQWVDVAGTPRVRVVPSRHATALAPAIQRAMLGQPAE